MGKDKEAKVVGFNLLKVLAERIPLMERPTVKMDMKIKEVKTTKIDLGKGKEVIAFDFEYTILYDEAQAKISFEGNVLILTDEKIAREIMKDWDKNKSVEKGIRTGVFNVIFQKCNLKALQLEEDINLPFHMAMPVLQPVDKKEDKEE